MDYDPNDAPRTSSAADAARDAAKDLKDDAEKAIGEIRGRGMKGFFNFEFMYFPIIARYVFVVIVILVIIGMIFGVLANLAALVGTSIIGGIIGIVMTLIGGGLTILFTRISFEMILLGFKIYEEVREVNRKTRG